jgi:hypothetical protein
LLDDDGQIVDGAVVVNEDHFLTDDFPCFSLQDERVLSAVTV